MSPLKGAQFFPPSSVICAPLGPDEQQVRVFPILDDDVDRFSIREIPHDRRPGLAVVGRLEKPPPAHSFEPVALMAALMEAMRTARLPLRPVLMETCFRLHECGRGERGV
jgi:hypothetical protein